MAYQTFQQFNRTDVAGLFVYPAQVVPIFIPLILFALFSIVLLATYFSQRRLTGKGNFFASFAVAGYLTAIIAFMMTLIEGMINPITLAITVSVAIIGTILLFIPKGD